MKKLKLRTKQDVHIRKNEPWRRSNNLKGIIYKGQEFEIEVDEIEDNTCEEIENIKKWFKDGNGDYLWSGGFEVVNNEQKSNHSQLFNYKELINIRNKNGLGDGNNIQIAVLDSGLYYNHTDFDKNKIKLPSIYNSINEIKDVNGHGTHIAGIIAANSDDETGVKGISPLAYLNIFKVIDTNGATNFDQLKNSLDYILKNHHQFDIINLSLDITQDQYDKISGTIKKIHDFGVIMVAAAGNNKDLQERICYPAYSDFIISVGTVNNKYFRYYKENGFYKRIDFFFLNEDIYSTYKKPLLYYNSKNCSVYTALVSGLIGSIISKNNIPKNSDIKNKIVAILNKCALYYNNINTLSSLTLYKTK